MPFVVIIIGLMLIAIGYNGTQKDFLTLLKGDFIGPNNFIYWVLALFVLGLIGYAPKLKGFSDAFLALVLIALFLSNKGFFSQFISQIQSLQTPSANSTGVTTP